MAWVEPKTDWSGSSSNGVYTGDYFTYIDYNRIKNNIAYLSDLASQVYNGYESMNLGSDKTVNDYFFADEVNMWTSILQTLAGMLNITIGAMVTYVENDATPTYYELNAIESACAEVYNALRDVAYDNRRMFTWNFGIGKEF